MATHNMTRLLKSCEKKTKSVAMVKIRPDLLPAGVLAADILQMANLPPHAIVTDAYAVINTPMDAAITANVGFAGGAELGNNLTMDAAANSVVAGALVDNGDHLNTVTGKVLTVVLSAVPTVGDVDIVVEYTEHTLGNGILTAII